MSKLRLTLAACVLAAALPAAGQGMDGLPLGLSLGNPALLDSWTGRAGTVALEAQKENGGAISLSESPDSYQAGASAEAYNRIGSRLTFHGKLHWQYFHGNNMGGQILMDPAYNPVNFLESTEDTKGAKHRESYSLEGGLSYRIGERWAAGVGISYQAADQTKVKDPRFSNIWMDLDLKAGFSFQPGNGWILGAGFRFRNTLEQLKGGIYGTTDRQYIIATDKGAFLGTTDELAGDDNAISVNNFRPLMNYLVGGSLQAVKGDVFVGETWLLLRNGYYGRKSSATATFYEHNGFQAGLKGKLVLGEARSRHRIGLEALFESLTNLENKFSWVTPPGQTTRVVVYTGQSPILERLQARAQLDYIWERGSRLRLGASMEGWFQDQSVSIFPRTRHQTVISLGADVFGAVRFGALDVELHALAGAGFGTPKEDGMAAGASSTTIKSYDNYLNRQYEYDTAPRAGFRADVTWNLSAWGEMLPYVKLSEQFVHLLDAPQYLEGAARNVAILGIGLRF